MALPKTTDSTLPAVAGMAYVGESDNNSAITVASGQYYMANNNWVKVSDQNPLPTKVSNITGFQNIITNESTRDNAIHFVLVSLGDYSDFDFIITNNTNQDMKVAIAPESGSSISFPGNDGVIKTYSPSVGANYIYHTVPKGSNYCPLSLFPLTGCGVGLPYKMYHTKMKLSYCFNTPPTSGMISVVLMGSN